MGVRPSYHASRVSAADTRDPSVLGSETSALPLAAAARGELRGARLVSPVDRCSRRQNALHDLSRARAGAASCIRSHAQVPSYDAPSSAACAVRPAAAPGAHTATHTPRSCPPTAHAARPPCLLMVTTSVLTCHTRVYVLGPHIRQFPVLPSARLCCTSAPRHARNRRSSAL